MAKRFAAFHVDAQKGFTELCPEELPIVDGHTIVPELLYMSDCCDITIGSKDAHPYDALWNATDEKPMGTELPFLNVDKTWNRHCVVGTKGFELLDGLPEPVAYDHFVWKGSEPDMHPYGACYHDLHETVSTGVIEKLYVEKIHSVIVGGLAYDFCVGTTAMQLKAAGLDVYVYVPATKGISDKTIAEMNQQFDEVGIIRLETESELFNLTR